MTDPRPAVDSHQTFGIEGDCVIRTWVDGDQGCVELKGGDHVVVLILSAAARRKLIDALADVGDLDNGKG